MDATAIVEAITAGDRRIASRLISRAEAGDAGIVPALAALYKAGGRARTIGVTGPPGAGKSTLVDRLVDAYRKRGSTVAVIAVDPSSPFSGGAVLGDRVRMSRHSDDPGVFIRSMATRGALGGLTRAVGDAVTILDALGFDLLIIETVGVGQSEIDIVSHAAVVLLLQTPMGGDDVQAVKAGIVEIADIMVVNKKSAPGADRTLNLLKETLHERSPRADGWLPLVVATEASTGEGVDALVAKIDAFVRHGEQPDNREARLRRQLGARVFALCEARLRRATLGKGAEDALGGAWSDVIARRSDPYALADWLVSEMTA
ncbi:MAG: transport system ATPase [Sphingomonadales bacterium]|nr:transport system ATPase [Sphingomonadales bacterium]